MKFFFGALFVFFVFPAYSAGGPGSYIVIQGGTVYEFPTTGKPGIIKNIEDAVGRAEAENDVGNEAGARAMREEAERGADQLMKAD